MEIRGEVSASVRGGGGAPPPVQKRPAATPSEDWKSERRCQRQFAAGVGPRRQCRAPAATPERGHGDPSEGVSVSSRRGWGPAASAERLRPHRAEDMEIRGEVSASVRGGGGAPPPVQEAPAATPERGHEDPSEGVSVSSRWGWGPSASADRHHAIVRLSEDRLSSAAGASDAQRFFDTLNGFCSVLAVKLYRLRLDAPPRVPVLPCLDHEAMLHEGIAPHAAAYVQDLSGNLHEVVYVPGARRMDVEVASTLGECSGESQDRFVGELKQRFPGCAVRIVFPSRLRGE